MQKNIAFGVENAFQMLILISNAMFGAIAGFMYGLAIYLCLIALIVQLPEIKNLIETSKFPQWIELISFWLIVLINMIIFSLWYYRGFVIYLKRKQMHA